MSYTETIEIEKKFYTKQKSPVLDALSKLGWEKSSTSIESDTYLTDIEGRFIENRTCLRGRFKEGRNVFTLDYKPASQTNNSFFIKKESNIEFPIESYWGVFELLNNLGYHKYVTVEKHRESFNKKSHDVEAVVTLDEIVGIGLFIELELTVPVSSYDSKESIKIFDEIFKDVLSLEAIEEINLPYRDIVAKKFYEIWLGKKKNIYIDWDSYLWGRTFLNSENSKDLALLERLSLDAFNGKLPDDKKQGALLENFANLSESYHLHIISSDESLSIPDGATRLNPDSFVPSNSSEDLYVSSSESFSSKVGGDGNLIYLSYKPRVKIKSGALHIDSLQELSLISKYSPKS